MKCPFYNHRRPELILVPVLCSQSADDVSHLPGSRLPVLSVRHAFTLPYLLTCEFDHILNIGQHLKKQTFSIFIFVVFLVKESVNFNFRLQPCNVI